MDFLTLNWSKEDYTSLYEYLVSLAEPDYCRFNQRIVKTELPMLGIRSPLLKKTSKAIAKGDYRAFLANLPHDLYEFILLQAFVTAFAPLNYSDFLQAIERLIAVTDNWAVCDSFCSAVNPAPYRDALFDHIPTYLAYNTPWHSRMGLVLMLFKYLDDEHIDEVLSRCDSIHSEHYYVKMAQAWLVSIAYIRYPEKTLAYLALCSLDDWTYNKAISKTRDSYRVSSEEKAFLWTLRR